MQYNRILIIILRTLTIAMAMILPGPVESSQKVQWVSKEERIKVWDAVGGAGNYTVLPNGIEAVIQKDGASWLIMGANVPIVNPTKYPATWPVKDSALDVLVVSEPISNEMILPFTEVIKNAVRSEDITITAAPDSYEPVSIIIRTGDSAVDNVIVEVSDLSATEDTGGQRPARQIPKSNIDIRVVKCWYQAGDQMNEPDNKMLKPELLLHDDDLVRVDYEGQVDLVRDYERVQDAESLKPFSIPRRQNKQVWLSIHIDDTIVPGAYSGSIVIKAGRIVKRTLKLNVEVLPFTLPEPILDYALFYEGYLSERKGIFFESRHKTAEQMYHDLVDMKKHGLTNATVWHEVNVDRSKWGEDWERLKRTLDIRKKVGWGAKPLLYLDWKTRFKEDLDVYKEKVRMIVSIAASYGINDVYIYGEDERRGEILHKLRPLYAAVHEAGAKNFVAITDQDLHQYVPDLIDIPIIWGIPGIHTKNLTAIKQRGIKAWKYSHPPAGQEEPETYRKTYGLQLYLDGYSGACNYQYQRGSWNDFGDPNYRQQTMAYPTVTSPIPTIQWEGWRKGVDDVRYFTAAYTKKVVSENAIKRMYQGNLSMARHAIIKVIEK